MYDTNKQSKNGIVVSYKHIVPENKIIKIGIRKMIENYTVYCF